MSHGQQDFPLVLQGFPETQSFLQITDTHGRSSAVSYTHLTIIADHSHTDFDKVWADSDRDYWMTAQEAKEYGMIDEVLSRKPATLSCIYFHLKSITILKTTLVSAII